jgi:hypothetical protein
VLAHPANVPLGPAHVLCFLAFLFPFADGRASHRNRMKNQLPPSKICASLDTTPFLTK